MTNFRNAMMASAHTASGTSLVEVGNSALYTTTSQELERTPGSAGNVDKFTFSAWVYMCNPTSGNTPIFGAINTSANQHRLFTTAGGTLQFDLYLSNSFVGRVISSQVLRDIGWYHIVAVYDSGNNIAGNRMRIYLNGERITDLTSVVDPSQNLDGLICGAHLHQIGMHDGFGTTLDGYMAEAVLLDGTVAEPSSFGQYDSTGTFWTPKSSAEIKALTFGTTGFYLDNTTNAQTDASGTGNNFTNTGSVTLSTHTPTNLNALFNPLNFLDITTRFPVMTVGNTTTGLSTSGSSATGGLTFPVTYNTHIEFIFSVAAASGFDHQYPTFKVFPFNGPYDTALVQQPSGNFANDAGLASGATRPNFANGDRITMEIDASNGRIYLWQNGSALNSANPGSNSGFTFDYTPPASGAVILAFTNGNSTSKALVNSNPADFEDTVSAGYFPLTSTAITAQTTRTKSNLEEYFDSTLYEGTGSEQNVVSDTTTNTSAFSWIKNRDAADNHMLFDRVRGATKDIHSNTTDIEVTNAQTVKAFIGGGVTLGTDAEVNTSSESYVLWNWMMETAGSGSSNTDGTINTTSTLVDTNLGLSISTYTGTGANATIGHGLGVVPEFFMVKILDTGGTDWMVYHSALGATKNLVLNKTTSFSTSITRWNNTEPTSSLISLGTTTAVNGSGSTYVCYAFAPSQFISIGSYNGNGNANGTFIPTVNSLGIPIQPAWFMARSTGSGQDWRIVDNKRNPSNVNNLHLRANTTAADTSETNLDIDTGGIKIRTSSGGWNTSGTEYIYLAFGTPIIDVDGRIIGGR